MTEVSERYARVANGFQERFIEIQPDQWTSATPCSDWDVQALVTHAITTNCRIVALVNQSVSTEVDNTDDLMTKWSLARHAVDSALEDSTQATTKVSGMFGEQTFESLVSRLLCGDLLFHTWDLARATGQDESLDNDAVAKALEFLTSIDDAIRRPGGFAPKITPSPNTDLQTQLLCFGGRQP